MPKKFVDLSHVINPDRDHVHEWELWNDYTYSGETGQWAECRCGEKLLGDEMVRRLNAIEQLPNIS